MGNELKPLNILEGGENAYQLLEDLVRLADGRKYHYRLYDVMDEGIYIVYSEREFAHEEGLLELQSLITI